MVSTNELTLLFSEALDVMQAFVTGSRAYGKPTRDSDVDLVVLVSYADMRIMQKLADDGRWRVEKHTDSDSGDPETTASLKFGNLNLICVTDPIDYAVWQKGTKILKHQEEIGHRITRGVATEFFRALRTYHGASAGDGTLSRDEPDIREYLSTEPEEKNDGFDL